MTDKSLWDLRLDLARKSIRSEFRISMNGITQKTGFERSVGFWAKSWYWKGWICEISIHDHAIIDLRDEEGSIAKIRSIHERVHEAFSRASVEFTDDIPCMDHQPREDGKISLAVNTWEMSHSKGRERIYFPTEIIPEGIENPQSEETILRGYMKAAAEGFEVEDKLMPISRPGSTLRDCKDRAWEFELRVAARTLNGIAVSYKPMSFKSQIIQEPFLEIYSASAIAGMKTLFKDYAPGGCRFGSSANGLPPGFMTREEFLATVDLSKIKDEEDAPSP